MENWDQQEDGFGFDFFNFETLRLQSSVTSECPYQGAVFVNFRNKGCTDIIMDEKMMNEKLLVLRGNCGEIELNLHGRHQYNFALNYSGKMFELSTEVSPSCLERCEGSVLEITEHGDVPHRRSWKWHTTGWPLIVALRWWNRTCLRRTDGPILWQNALIGLVEI